MTGKLGVDHGGADVFVAEEFLDGADVVAGFEEMGGERVTVDVKGDAFGDVRAFGGIPQGFLHHAGIEMVAVPDTGAGIG